MSGEKHRENKPPRQYEGILTVKKQVPCLISSRKYFCVLFGCVLQLFDNEKSYSSKKQNPKAQIDLTQVCSISETIQVPKGQKINEGFCFKIELFNHNEVVFSAKTKEEVKCWVDCLKETKLFYENYSAKEDILTQSINQSSQSTNHNERDSPEEVKPHHNNPSDISFSIIMSHGQKYTAYMEPDGDINDLWSAILKWLPGHFCERCENCRLRRSTMELWFVDDGVAIKVNKTFTDFGKKEFYLLEHSYKLLIVHFEDSTFLVSPADISIKSKEVPEMEVFARKLASIECNNAQLYVLTSSNAEMPFSPDEQPLTDYFWEMRANGWLQRDRKGDKLLLKSRALVTPLNPQATTEKYQETKAKKILEERRQKVAIKEIENCQVKKKALKKCKADDTGTNLPAEWSESLTPQAKSKNFRQCILEVPVKTTTPGKQETVPFDYISDEENSVVVKERRSSEGDKAERENVLVKKRAVSESGTQIIRKGAIRCKGKTMPRRRTLPFVKSNTSFGQQFLPADANGSENIESKERTDDSCFVIDGPSRPADDMLPSGNEVLDDSQRQCSSFNGNTSLDQKSNGLDEVEEPSEREKASSAPRKKCCNYYKVESPCMLKPILEQYTRLSKGEEEVNGILPPKCLCLSSIHLINKDNYWSIENNENSSVDHEFDNCEVFILPPNIKVSFVSSTRSWNVQCIERDKSKDSDQQTDCSLNNSSESSVVVNFLSKQTVSPELTMLENAIKKIFLQASLVDGLDDTKSPDVCKVVCLDLCSSLHSILIHGLKKRRTLFGTARYTLWEVVDTVTTRSMPEGSKVLQKINRLGVLEDKLCLELFVCECLNKGAEALAEWFDHFIGQKQTLQTFYNEHALMRASEGCDVVQKLSRLSFLPFHLTYFDKIEKKLEKERLATFNFE